MARSGGRRGGRLMIYGVAAAAATTALCGFPASHASAASPLASMQRAIAAARSFHAAFVVKITSGPRDSTINTINTIDMILIHRGPVAQVSIAATQTYRRQRHATQIVDDGSRSCTKLPGSPRWTCGRSMHLGKLYTSFQSTVLASASSHAKISVTPAGSSVVQGVACNVYTISASGDGASSSGRLWAASATGLPVRETFTSTEATKGQPPTTLTGTATWSNWNDPSLKLPVVSG